MASVPNMRLGPAAPANGAGVPVDGEAGDLFARLLSSTPLLDGSTELSIAPEASPAGEAPIASDEQAEGEEILLALTNGMAFQPVAVPAAPAGEAPSQPPVPEAPAAAPTAAATAPTTIVTADPKAVLPTAAPPAFEAPAPVQPQVTTAPAGQPAEPAAPDAAKIELVLPDAVAIGRPQAKEPAARMVPPAVREAQAAAIAAPAVEAKPGRPAERSKAIPAPGLSDKPAAPLAPAAPLPFLTPAAVLGAAAPDLAMTAQPLGQEVAQPQDVAQQLIEHELDLAQDSEWLDQLARDIARSGGSEGPIRFRLHPQTLGHMQVEVAQGDQGAAIRLTVETEAARAIIADAQPRLVSEARAQGVRVAETHVDLAGARDHSAGEQRRHEDGRQNATIRTVRAPAGEAESSAAEPRAQSERYA